MMDNADINYALDHWDEIFKRSTDHNGGNLRLHRH